MKEDDKLLAFDRMIKSFERLVQEFPKNPPYQDRLTELQQARVDYVNQIGRKHENC